MELGTWGMEISHTGPGLCLYVLVRVELGIAILRAPVLRKRDCIASLRSGCPSAVACGPPVSTHLCKRNLDSAMPGADIYIWLPWLALFLSDLHLLPTGHLLVSLKPTANNAGLPLYALPPDPHGQRQAAL
ncbi:hypothetical protein GGI35DRAFT_152539 [Trichoderma velutinum]